MAIQLVGSNLNIFGGAGNFEADPSTWGFSGDGTYSIVRSLEQKTKGLYAAKLTMLSELPGGSFNFFTVCPGRFNAAPGKKYLAKAKVFTPAASVLGNADLILSLGQGVSSFALQQILAPTTTNPVACTNTWVNLQWQFQLNPIFSEGLQSVFIQLLGGNFGGTGEVNIGGILFIDEFEIFEYIEVDDPEDPTPTPEPEIFDIVFHSKNPITLSKTAPAGWNLLTNFRLYNDVVVEDVADSGTYNSKLKVDLPPNTLGTVTFYLAEAFRDVFTFNPPTLNQSKIIRLTDRIKRFKNLTGSLQNTETVPDTVDESIANLVLFGGVSKEKWPGLNFFSTYLPEKKMFLTWAPVEKQVDRLQEDYLNFWVYDDTIASLKLNLKVYFDDGTNQTSVVQTITGTNYGELYQIPSGPANTGVHLVDPTKNVTHYELSLLDQDNTEVSEVRTFYISSVRHPLTRFFMFLNSLGSFEVLRFTGQAIQRADFARDVTQKFLAHNYESLDGEFSVNTVTIQKKNSYSSGFVKERRTKEWHEYLIDFLRSPIIFDVTSGSRSPVVITAGIHERVDQEYARFIQFEAKPSYDDESFTPETI